MDVPGPGASAERMEESEAALGAGHTPCGQGAMHPTQSHPRGPAVSIQDALHRLPAPWHHRWRGCFLLLDPGVLHVGSKNSQRQGLWPLSPEPNTKHVLRKYLLVTGIFKSLHFRLPRSGPNKINLTS